MQSTAKFVSYDLRPSKQIERKMILDSLSAAMESGFSISDYRYVGMGGNRFYDFVLMHKFLGIKKMVSLEHDSYLMPRVMYNRPYKFIKVENVDVQSFLAGDSFSGNTIYWMDYDGSIKSDITRDVASLAPRVKPRDFVFVTMCAEPPRWIQSMKSAGRLEEIRERFGALAGTLTTNKVENSNFRLAVHAIVEASFRNAFVVRHNGVFLPFFQVNYRDGREMFTFGGVFASSRDCERYSKILKLKMPFLLDDAPKKYSIKKFDLTERERALFDQAATSVRSNAREIGEIGRLGFGRNDLARYRELLRFHPRYVETFL